MRKVRVGTRTYKVLERKKVNNYPTKVLCWSKHTKSWEETPNVNIKLRIQRKLNK